MNHRSTRREVLASVAAIALLTGTSACTPTVDHRGYLPRQGDLARVQVGMSKTEVEGLLGSPSTTATIDYQGDSYYYISSVVSQTAFFDAEETDRKVFAVRFDRDNQVQSFGHYGLEHGQVVAINDRTTPTRGRELSILQQIFGNIGKFDPGQVQSK